MTMTESGPGAPSNESPFARAAGQLIALGYHVIPIIPPSASHPGAGKSPGNFTKGAWWGMKEWERFRDRLPTEFERALWARNFPDANIGIVCGSAIGDQALLAVDIDTTDPDEFDTLISLLPRSPMAKRGDKGLTLFYRAPSDIKSKSYNVTGRRIVDLLTGFDTRQTVVPPSAHKSGATYAWVGSPCRPAELPVFDADNLEKLEDGLASMGWNPDAVSNRVDAPSRGQSYARDDESYWGEVKQAAYQNLSAWAPALDLYGFRPARRGFEAVATWRQSCTGRPTEKRKRNLSIQPDGIKDFGTGQNYSPIDLVMAALNMGQGEATAWLRARLGFDDSPAMVLDLTPAPVSEPVREPEAVKAEDELPESLTRVPGLLGELVNWICDTSRRPQRGLALGAALTLIGTAAGRRYAGPTRTGTHLYVLGLARTSAGKDHALSAIPAILHAAGLGRHAGPSQFMSFQALINRMLREPQLVCPMDEFGAFLARINAKGGKNGHEQGISPVLRQLWGASFKTYMPPEWAGKSPPALHSPALSIYGVSTHEEFYAAIQGVDISNGFLNRFLLFSTQKKPAERDPKIADPTTPESIVNGLKLIAGGGGPLFSATMNNGAATGAAITAKWADKAAGDAYSVFGRMVEKREEADGAFYARTVEMAQRIATIRAIGENPTFPVIDAACFEWAADLALRSAERMIGEASDHMAENPFQADVKRVLRIIRASVGPIEHGRITRALDGRMRAKEIKDALDVLIDSGAIEVFERSPGPAGGRRTFSYMAPKQG